MDAPASDPASAAGAVTIREPGGNSTVIGWRLTVGSGLRTEAGSVLSVAPAATVLAGVTAPVTGALLIVVPAFTTGAVVAFGRIVVPVVGVAEEVPIRNPRGAAGAEGAIRRESVIQPGVVPAGATAPAFLPSMSWFE